MKEEEIQRIQNELLKSFDKEQQMEEMVENLSGEIAAKLVLENKATAEVNGLEYMFAYRFINKGKKQFIYMTVANLNKYRLLQEKYVPYTVTAEIDNDFTLKENLKATVEAYLRHILDMVKAEEIK